MRFCPWYPLASAGEHTPAGGNVLQVRVEHGLVDYPRGKSAMVRYAYADDARALARRFAEELGAGYLCRHLESDPEGDLAGFAAALTETFVQRFGGEPTVPPHAREEASP